MLRWVRTAEVPGCVPEASAAGWDSAVPAAGHPTLRLPCMACRPSTPRPAPTLPKMVAMTEASRAVASSFSRWSPL